jgi:tRNA A22 N-methylase
LRNSNFVYFEIDFSELKQNQNHMFLKRLLEELEKVQKIKEAIQKKKEEAIEKINEEALAEVEEAIQKIKEEALAEILEDSIKFDTLALPT